MENFFYTARYMFLVVLLLHNFKPSTIRGNVFYTESVHHTNLGSRRRYIRLRDVNIGASLRMTSPMLDRLNYVGNDQLAQAIEYAIDDLNKNKILPSGFEFGFVVLDNWGERNMAMVSSTSFIPQACPADASSQNYDVIGAVGYRFSSFAIQSCQVLGPARIPVVSFYATSDSLSDKSKFPYFLRVVAPNRFLFSALGKFIAHNGWDYVSVVYTDESYGRNGFDVISRRFSNDGVCMAQVHRVSLHRTREYTELITKALVRKHQTVRVVLLLVFDMDLVSDLLESTAKYVPEGTFIWVGSDGINPLLLTPAAKLLYRGSFNVEPGGTMIPAFQDYYRNLTLTHTANPWFKEAFETAWNCSSAGGRPRCPTDKPMGNKSELVELKAISRLIDSVVLLGSAAARVLNTTACANTTNCTARDYIDPQQLLDQLKATDQEGYTGRLKLDENGDLLGNFDIFQYVDDDLKSVKVSEFDTSADLLTRKQRTTWKYHRLARGATFPNSRCSEPCHPGQIHILRMVKCCWRCKACRLNEFVKENECRPCPENEWPDKAFNFTACMEVTLGMRIFGDPVRIVQLVLSVMGLLACVAVGAFFLYHGNNHVIKASSRELSAEILFATALGYATALSFLAIPSRQTCIVNFVMFSVSFNLIYGPLLVKTVRIYRIFYSSVSAAGALRLRMIGSSYQLIFSFLLLIIQVLICVSVTVHYSNGDWQTQMYSPEKRVVKLMCDIPLAALLASLTYNLLLVVVCVVLAVKTRHLPDNFSESLFIAVCVTGTLILWGCFLVVYTFSPPGSGKDLSLVIALLCNNSLVVIFLFGSRVYAVLFGKRDRKGMQFTVCSAATQGTVMLKRRLLKRRPTRVHLSSDNSSYQKP